MGTGQDVLKSLGMLFGIGTAAGSTEGQLLERFLARRDEAAFEALVSRHGPMVLGVCRRLLRDPRDVEDAFQATFLILVRKAATLRDRELLGNWLYGVAHRVAVRARVNASRRRARERPGAEEAAMEPMNDRDQQELFSVLDEEIVRLPEKYRSAVVLCYIEGRTHEEAAFRLGCPVGTVKSRLYGARERLRIRLTRRGLAPSVLFLGATLLHRRPVCEAVPAPLVGETVRVAAGLSMTGKLATGVVSASVAKLTEEVLKLMFLNKLRTVAWLVPALALALAGTVAGGLLATGGGEGAIRPASTPNGELAAADQAQPPEAAGRILDVRVVAAQTSAVVSGAHVVLDGRGSNRGVTDAKGHCPVSLPTDNPILGGRWISVWKDGFSPVRVDFSARDLNDKTFTTYTVELEPAGPMGGIVRDEQGRPIAGAKVDLSLASRGPIRFRGKGREMFILGGFEPLTTDALGRWQCHLLPDVLTDDDRVEIRLSHPDFVSDVTAPSRPRASLKSLRDGTSVLVMTKGFPATGTVSGPDGRPVEGATVSLSWIKELRPPGPERYTTKADPKGRFQFDHARPGEQALTVEASGLAPELARIEVTAGVNPFAVRLKPGRTIQGRVVDESGKPVVGVVVHADSWRGYSTLDWSAETDADGRFRWDHAPDDAVSLRFWRASSGSRVQLEVGPDSGEVAVTIKNALRVRGTVVDAESGRPIDDFRLIPGLIGLPGGGFSGRNQKLPRWQLDAARTGRAGRYEFVFAGLAPKLPRSLRVEAEGYLPAESRAYQNDEGDQTFDVRLRRSANVAGVIRLPDGSPLAGAQVLLSTPSDFVRLEDGRFSDERFQGPRMETRADGRFSFPPQAGPFTLVVVSDRGVAMVDDQSLPGSRDVTVQPWGRVEGTVRIGTRPGADQAVVAISQRGPSTRGPEFRFISHGVAANDGRFVIDRVVPGPVQVGRSDPLFTHLVSAEATAGRMASVTIGGTGRPVIGRIVPPAEMVATLDLTRARGRLELVLPPPYPAEFATWDAQRKQAWWAEFRATDAGRDYFRRDNRYGVAVAASGTFRAEDVPAGTYQLVITIEQLLDGPAGNVGPRLTGQARRQVVLPEVPGGRTDQPFDVGAVELVLKQIDRSR